MAKKHWPMTVQGNSSIVKLGTQIQINRGYI